MSGYLLNCVSILSLLINICYIFESLFMFICVYVYHVYTWRSGEEIRVFGTGVRGCELPCGYWEPNSAPCKERSSLHWTFSPVPVSLFLETGSVKLTASVSLSIQQVLGNPPVSTLTWLYEFWWLRHRSSSCLHRNASPIKPPPPSPSQPDPKRTFFYSTSMNGFTENICRPW